MNQQYHQLTLNERKVYDGRKTDHPTIEQICKDAPCFYCTQQWKCTDTQLNICPKMTAWLIATGGN